MKASSILECLWEWVRYSCCRKVLGNALKGQVFAVWNQKLRGGTHTAGVVCFQCDVAGREAWLCGYG